MAGNPEDCVYRRGWCAILLGAVILPFCLAAKPSPSYLAKLSLASVVVG